MGQMNATSAAASDKVIKWQSEVLGQADKCDRFCTLKLYVFCSKHEVIANINTV
jgi:hypothetical protein